MKATEFLEYVKEAKSKATFKNYKQGIKKFVEWSEKPADTILKERFQDLQSQDKTTRKRFNREIEKFHRHLKNLGHSQNTAVAYTEGIRQLFRYYDMDIKDLPTEVTKKVATLKDYIPTVQQYRDLFNCGNVLDRTIISLGLDLGWRIGDFKKIRKDRLPSLEQPAPIPFELIIEKEDVIAKSFLSQETVDLLKEYLPTVKDNPNPYLLPSNTDKHFDEESINRVLRELAAKANVKIPKTKRLRFHAFRKRFLSECANLHIDVNTAKILVGKSVAKDMLRYLSEVEHREAFIRVHQKLRLTATPMRRTRASATELEKEVDRLRRMINIIGAINPEIVKRADRMLEGLGVTMTAEQFGKMTFGEKLNMIAKEQERKQREEYARIIAENNNNNH